jgi:hypothetical protein
VKALVLTTKQWGLVLSKIKQDYPPSVWLSREKMRRSLGFTPREHTDWLGYYDSASIEDRKAGKHGHRTTYHLDFFSDYHRSFFLLKYGDWISEHVENV